MMSRVCIVQPNPCSPSETFLRTHAEYLPADVVVLAGAPAIDGRPVHSPTRAARAWRKVRRLALRRTWYDDLTAAYLRAFRHYRPDAVLAEYGTAGVDVAPACRRAGLPLVVHFHGYDASKRPTLEAYADRYPAMFRAADAVVGVSRSMCRRLVRLGAPEDRVHWNPYGVDCASFHGARPSEVPPVFLAVGRFCPKKSPGSTLRAFAMVRREIPEARLRMIGFGPLLEPSVALAGELGVTDAVTFLGTCPPPVVREEMRQARCFVQHSVVAPDGDSEGTPVSVLEAGASGLPVVSTRHEGIPDVVLEGETGLLVDEGDVTGMAAHMLTLARDPALAARLGQAARARVAAEFSVGFRIRRLWEIIESCMARGHGAPGGATR